MSKKFMTKLNIIKVFSVAMIVFALLFGQNLTAKAGVSLSATVAVPNTDTQVQLNWTPVANATYYIIYRDGYQIKLININNTRDYLSYIDTGLQPNTTYDYTLKVLDNYMDEIDSASASVRTSAMLKPTNLSASYNSNTGKVTIQWTNNSLATVRSVIKRADGSDVATVYSSSTNCSYTFTDTKVVSGGAQYYIVCYDSYGNSSEPSDMVSVTSTDFPSISAVMENGVATIILSSSKDITGISVERSKYTGYSWTSWTKINTAVISNGKIYDTPEDPGTYRYRLYLYAGNQSGYTNVSNSVSKPAAPSELQARISSSSRIDLSWTIDYDNDCKLLVQRKSGQSDYVTLATLDARRTSYSDTSLTLVNTTYTYRIVAYDSDKNMSVSNEVSITTGVPTSPSILYLTVTPENWIELFWSDDTNNESGFIIERKTNDGDFVEIKYVAADTTSYTDYTVVDGYVYSYRIRSYNPYGKSDTYSNVVTTTTENVVPAPDSFEATVVSSSQIDLAWSYASLSDYSTTIERKIGKDGKWTILKTLSAGVNEFSDKNLTPDTQYFYRIRAAGGAYIYSPVFPDENGLKATTMLIKPTDVQGSALSSTEIVISWKYGKAANEFVIERKTDNEDFAPIAYTPYNTTTWHDTGLTPGKKYVYRIRAKSADNVSEYSDEISIASIALNAPSDLSAAAISDASIELSWKDTSNNSSVSFEVWRKKGDTGTWEKVTALRRATSFVVSSLSPNAKYYYKVRAYIMLSGSEPVYSPFSPEITAFTTVPPAPDNLQFEIVSRDSIRLMWSDNSSNESKFIIQGKAEFDNYWTDQATVLANAESCMIYDLREYTTYLYRVVAYSSTYNSYSYSDAIEVYIAPPESPIRLTVSATSPNEAVLKWIDLSDNESEFIIERRKADEDFKYVARVGANVTQYVDKGLEPETQYFYRVKAHNNCSDSEYTNEASVTTGEVVIFLDLRTVEWAREAILNLAARGIIKGKADKIFAPNDTITRAEFTSLLMRAFGLSKIPVGSFNDVNISHWAYNELMTARIYGIITADENGNFRPDDPITREELAVILVNTLKAVGKPLPTYSLSMLNKYMDRDQISSNAVSSILSLIGEGIMNGRSDDILAPKDTATRAEAALMLYKVIDRN